MSAIVNLSPSPLAPISELCAREGWLAIDRDNIIRCPLLVKGELVGPARVTRAAIDRAFAELDRGRTAADPYASYAAIDNVQVLRHAEIDRATMRASGRWIYRVMPVLDPLALPERDFAALDELYAMPYERVLEWLVAVRSALAGDPEIVARVRELERATSEHPDAFVDAAFMALPILLDPEHAITAVDSELAHHGATGRQLLDGWVELPAQLSPGPAHVIGAGMMSPRFANALATTRMQLRAMPTRQLHITAGNSPLIPLFSLLRAVWTKSPSVIKLPGGAALPGALVALAAATAAPEHPLTRHLSLVYWRGGDAEVERLVLAPGMFDRIVVWGEPDAVASVKQRSALTKVLTFNPRYAASMIGREALGGDLDEIATRAVFDTMIENQKACIASLVHYVEGDVTDAERYAAAVSRALAKWDAHPHPLLDRHRGQLKRLARGALMDARVDYHHVDGEFRCGVVVAPNDFPIKDHPMCRLVVVRPVARLEDCLGFLHHGVATIGVYPEPRRLALRDRIAARGVSTICPLGQAGCAAVGMGHDGMLVLGELVDWKNA
jgi:acyl-CoA reductase LuxC